MDFKDLYNNWFIRKIFRRQNIVPTVAVSTLYATNLLAKDNSEVVEEENASEGTVSEENASGTEAAGTEASATEEGTAAPSESQPAPAPTSVESESVESKLKDMSQSYQGKAADIYTALDQVKAAKGKVEDAKSALDGSTSTLANLDLSGRNRDEQGLISHKDDISTYLAEKAKVKEKISTLKSAIDSDLLNSVSEFRKSISPFTRLDRDSINEFDYYINLMDDFDRIALSYREMQAACNEIELNLENIEAQPSKVSSLTSKMDQTLSRLTSRLSRAEGRVAQTMEDLEDINATKSVLYDEDGETIYAITKEVNGKDIIIRKSMDKSMYNQFLKIIKDNEAAQSVMSSKGYSSLDEVKAAQKSIEDKMENMLYSRGNWIPGAGSLDIKRVIATDGKICDSKYDGDINKDAYGNLKNSDSELQGLVAERKEVAGLREFMERKTLKQEIFTKLCNRYNIEGVSSFAELEVAKLKAQVAINNAAQAEGASLFDGNWSSNDQSATNRALGKYEIQQQKSIRDNAIKLEKVWKKIMYKTSYYN